MNYLLIGAIIVGAAVIIEIILSAKWNVSYFRTGIPIFVRRIDRAGGLTGISFDTLAKSTTTASAPPLAFRQLAPDLVAFRERGFNGYVPLMRGIIKSKAEEPSIVVAGLINWSAIVLAIVLVAFLRRSVTIVVPYYLAGFAILYFIQGVRLFRLGSALRRSKELPNDGVSKQ